MGWCVQCSGHVRGTLARGVLTDMRVRAVAVGTLGSYWGLIWLDALMRESVAHSSESHPPPFLAPNHGTAVSEWTRVEFLKWGETSGVSIDNHMR